MEKTLAVRFPTDKLRNFNDENFVMRYVPTSKQGIACGICLFREDIPYGAHCLGVPCGSVSETEAIVWSKL